MALEAAQQDPLPTPILLLKTKSTPTDAYEQLFSTPRDGLAFEPVFVPVLEHNFEQESIQWTNRLLQERKVGNDSGALYGGLIFTSQRAVEAFAQIVKDDDDIEGEGWRHLQDIPVYSVGPATTRALKAVSRHLRVFGEHTGSGDVLGRFILEHYAEWYRDRRQKPPLLFLVGEKRSDSIPKALMDDGLVADARIRVDEVVVYKTGSKASFKGDFKAALDATGNRPTRWVVVFSPTGCQPMLEELGLLDPQSGKAVTAKMTEEDAPRQTRIATIGPTTRDYLRKTFGAEPDVCADAPSPEGVWDGIARFISRNS